MPAVAVRRVPLITALSAADRWIAVLRLCPAQPVSLSEACAVSVPFDRMGGCCSEAGQWVELSAGGHGPSKAGPQSFGRWATTSAAASFGVSESPRTRGDALSGAYTMHDCASPTMNGRSLLQGKCVLR